MTEPAWKSILDNEIADEFDFHPATPDDAVQSQDYEVIGRFSLPEYKFVELRLYPSDTSKVYFVFNSEPDWLRLPVELTAEAFRKACSQYVQPALNLGSPTSNMSPTEAVQYLRDAQGRVALVGSPQTVKWITGLGDYDESMMQAENGFTLNMYLNPAPIRLATVNQGLYSQWSTAFSSSLMTITRAKVNLVDIGEARTYFVCEVQYYPSSHRELTKKLLKEHAGDLAALPSDLPIDVIGMFVDAQFHQLIGAEELANYVKEGSEGDVMPLAILTDEEDFESVFLPLATNDAEAVRVEVAMEAALRKNKIVYDAAIKKGVPAAVQENANRV